MYKTEIQDFEIAYLSLQCLSGVSYLQVIFMLRKQIKTLINIFKLNKVPLLTERWCQANLDKLPYGERVKML